MSEGLFIKVWLPLSKCRVLSLKCRLLVLFTVRGVMSVVSNNIYTKHFLFIQDCYEQESSPDRINHLKLRIFISMCKSLNL